MDCDTAATGRVRQLQPHLGRVQERLREPQVLELIYCIPFTKFLGGGTRLACGLWWETIFIEVVFFKMSYFK